MKSTKNGGKMRIKEEGKMNEVIEFSPNKVRCLTQHCKTQDRNRLILVDNKITIKEIYKYESIFSTSDEFEELWDEI